MSYSLPRHITFMAISRDNDGVWHARFFLAVISTLIATPPDAFAQSTQASQDNVGKTQDDAEQQHPNWYKEPVGTDRVRRVWNFSMAGGPASGIRDNAGTAYDIQQAATSLRPLVGMCRSGGVLGIFRNSVAA
jgi:hypothetical protein